MSHCIRPVGIALVSILASLAFTAVSHASTAGITNGTLVVSAQNGEDNEFTFGVAGANAIVLEEGTATGDPGTLVEITAGSGCTQVETYEVDCPLSSITSHALSVNLGDGDFNGVRYQASTHDAMTGATVTVNGGDGEDVVDDSPGNDTVHGGGSHDSLYGGGGNDTLYGDSGGDTLIDWGGYSDDPFGGNVTPDNPATPDSLIGGDGDDDIRVSQKPDGPDLYDGGSAGEVDGDSISVQRTFLTANIDLTGTASSGGTGENDQYVGFENVFTTAQSTITGNAESNQIFGSGLADTIQGGDGADVIESGSGNDTIDGGAGNDELQGGLGNDTVHGGADNDDIDGNEGADSIFGDAGADYMTADDSQVDTAIDCGTETDVAWLDDNDPAPVGCETVHRPSGTTGGGGGGGGGGTGGTTGSTGGTSGSTGGTSGSTGGVITTPATDPLAGLSAGQLFVAKTQQSPDMSAVGSTAVLTNGSTLDVQELYSGKLAKVNVVGRTTKKNVKPGVIQWKVKFNKKAAKAFKKKKTLKVTIKSTVTPPKGHGKAVVKSVKVTLKRGKAIGRCTAVPRAHASC